MDYSRYFLLAVTLALLSTAISQDNVTESGGKDSNDGQTPPVPELYAGNTTTEPPITEFSLMLIHDHSTTSSIVVNWEVALPTGYELRSFIVKTNKRDSTSSITSQPLEGSVRTYEIPDLVLKSYYNVCIETEYTANITEQNPEGVDVLKIECGEMFTIAAIRPDSVLAIICVILIFAFVLILSYLCYIRARKEFERERAEDEESLTGSMANGKKPVLLNPVDGNRPRSHIEDQDIPYITPTWEQIDRERRTAANV